jgi:succinate dehydrogenase hydrophobic anchor subunit
VRPTPFFVVAITAIALCLLVLWLAYFLATRSEPIPHVHVGDAYPAHACFDKYDNGIAHDMADCLGFK